ncbi:unnamed protein product [Fraxinus pennsylvanica]|uniref:Uncharacterized protein n=1 Tax=Fraxinus pennsylvanica TaxID=56036 RepID=A0AAD2A523_9LAMI|nr:unnamed protein product [Fraxinus pennsylvanica]
MNYENYNGHRHVIRVHETTPLHKWFKDSLDEEEMEISVNSYHHQGVKRLAERFVPIAFAPDGLIEGFYDPDAYNPEEAKFTMGLQFHPERMRTIESDNFDYPGCASAYQKKLGRITSVQKRVKFDREMEKTRKGIARSLSIARIVYGASRGRILAQESEVTTGAEFLEDNTSSSLQQQKRLKQMGATVRIASVYIDRLKLNDRREKAAKDIIGKMSIEQLSEMVSFYHMMGNMCSGALEKKLKN